MKSSAGCAAAVLLVLIATGTAAPQSPTPDPESIAAGMRIFRTKGDCQACHGWAADGRKMDTQMPDGAESADDEARSREADHRDQVRRARQGDARVRSPRLQRRPLLRHDPGRRSRNSAASRIRRRRCSRARSNRSPTSSLPRWSARARWIAPRASSTSARKSKPAKTSSSGLTWR